MFHSCTVTCVFWMIIMEPVIAPVGSWFWWCRKCAYGLRRLKMTSILWGAYKSRTGCSNVVQKQLKKFGCGPSFIFLLSNTIVSIFRLTVFHMSIGQVVRWSFSVMQVYRNVFKVIPKLGWPRSSYFWKKSAASFIWIFSTSASCFIFKFSRIAVLLKHLLLDSKSDLNTNGVVL